MANEIEITKVIFRKWKHEPSNILALFVEIPCSVDGYDLLSYEHVGQHGSADYQTCIDRTNPASADESKELKAELESIGYVLQVVQRQTQDNRAKRIEIAKKI